MGRDLDGTSDFCSVLTAPSLALLHITSSCDTLYSAVQIPFHTSPSVTIRSQILYFT